MSQNSIPLRVDPAFKRWAEEMIAKDPTLNQRKITKKLSEKKLIIGEIMFNPDFEEQIIKNFKEIDKVYEKNEEKQKRFFF